MSIKLGVLSIKTAYLGATKIKTAYLGAIKVLKGGWDILTASYGGSFTGMLGPKYGEGLQFNNDGTKCFIMFYTYDMVYEYTLSTPWLVSSRGSATSFSLRTQTSDPGGLFFKPDGTKMYAFWGRYGRVLQYTLSTPWSVSTASYDFFYADSSRIFGQKDLRFNNAGTEMIMLSGDGYNILHQYSLSTPWVINTASFTGSYTLPGAINNPRGMDVKPDGTRLYITQPTGIVYQFDFSTPWDLSNISYIGDTLNISSEISSYATSITFKNDGSNMYILDAANTRIYTYDL